MNVILFASLAYSFNLPGCDSIPALDRPENETDFWLNEAEHFVRQRVAATLNTGSARNAVVFVGSGMSMTTLAAARVHIEAEESQLSFEDFPGVGMLRTYCVDAQVADEACAATALFAGVKSNRGTVGVTAAVGRGSCEPIASEHQVVSLARDAQAAGKWVGVISTGQVTDASLSALYALAADDRWVNDRLVSEAGCGAQPAAVADIAMQLVHGEIGDRLRVVLGGGRREFRDRSMQDESGYPWRGQRGDGRDLIREWSARKYDEHASYVWNRTQLIDTDADRTDYLLGLFAHGDLTNRLAADEDGRYDDQPTLVEMTAKAIELLGRNEAGFLLVVVNAQIDEAHHRNWARIALDETAHLDRAVAVAKQMTNSSETMLLVTADHSHTLTYSGYAVRHNDIFGMADDGTWTADGLPIMTLSYAAGAGFKHNLHQNGRLERIDLRTLDATAYDFEFPAMVPADREMHGGDDVAIYASGPWAHLFGGSAEQSVVAHIVRFATCIGTTDSDDSTHLNACNFDDALL